MEKWEWNMEIKAQNYSHTPPKIARNKIIWQAVKKRPTVKRNNDNIFVLNFRAESRHTVHSESRLRVTAFLTQQRGRDRGRAWLRRARPELTQSIFTIRHFTMYKALYTFKKTHPQSLGKLEKSLNSLKQNVKNSCKYSTFKSGFG